MSEVLSQECKVLLQLLAKDLFKSVDPIEWETVDLKALYEEAKVQTVLAIAFNALPPEAEKLDPETYAKWQGTAFSVMQQSLNNNFANAKLTELLKNNNVEHCTIKGYASAHYYPNPSLRQMGDIDFLVYENAAESTAKLLSENGYEANGHDHELHFGFSKNKIIYELHIGVTKVPPGKEYVLKSLEDVIPKCVSVDSACGKIVIPSVFHHGVIMLMHMQRHMVNGSGIGLRHLADWAVFVASVSNDEWVDIFEKELKAIGLWQFAKTISKTAAIYLKMPLKEWFASADESLARELLNDIFDGGNFGRKNKLRGTQQIFIDRNHHDRNIIVRIFSGITNRVYNRFAFCKKYKFLLPIGYIAYAGNILFRMIFRNKKYHLLEVYKKGNEQFDTYTRLKFFESEQ